MSQVLITPDLLNNLKYDMENVKICKNNQLDAGDSLKESTIIVIFSNSDINAALYHLVKSLERPWENKAIATVLVQESIKNDFIQKLRQQLKPFTEDMATNSVQFMKALAVAKKLNAHLISGTGAADQMGPTLVCDFTHDQFGSSQPTGLITFHTFRTAKEAISLVSKENIQFSYASIWHENHAYAYELLAALKISVFFINCYHVPLGILEESAKERKSFVTMDNKYHYETMPCNGLQKSIVFPIGSIFAN